MIDGTNLNIGKVGTDSTGLQNTNEIVARVMKKSELFALRVKVAMMFTV